MPRDNSSFASVRSRIVILTLSVGVKGKLTDPYTTATVLDVNPFSIILAQVEIPRIRKYLPSKPPIMKMYSLSKL